MPDQNLNRVIQQKMKTFLVLATARASKENGKYPEDEKHAAVVFALADCVKNARMIATNHLVATEWRKVQITDVQPVNIESLNSSEPTARNAYECAQLAGSHAIIFTDAID